jgi:hypothetical protein
MQLRAIENLGTFKLMLSIKFVLLSFWNVLIGTLSKATEILAYLSVHKGEGFLACDFEFSIF